MLHTITNKKGTYFIIYGPSSVTVKQGSLKILNKNLNTGENFILKANKSLPCECVSEDDVILEISIRTNDINNCIRILPNNPIPKSWENASKTIVSFVENHFENNHKENFTIIVVGRTRGKTTQVVYHSNLLFALGRKMHVIDGDMGQQSLYMPGSVALASFTQPVLSFSELMFEDARFTGLIRADANSVYIQSLRTVDLAKSVSPGSIIMIDTDGWISDAGLIQKMHLIHELKPNLVLVLDSKEPEYFSHTITQSLEEKKITYILIPDDNEYYLARSVEDRKDHRQTMYYRFFSHSTDLSFQRTKIALFSERFDVLAKKIVKEPFQPREIKIKKGTLCGCFTAKDQFLGTCYYLESNQNTITFRLGEHYRDLAYIIIGKSWVEI